MKKTIIVIALILFFGIKGSGFEFGKHDSFDEVLEKKVPYKVKDVIHTQNTNGITIVMYTTEPDQDEFPAANFDALAVAFLKGNNQDGWENIGPNSWNHYHDENMTVYMDVLHEYKEQEGIKQGLDVVYGEINNPSIQRIETRMQQEKLFKEADIVTYKTKRYYIQLGREHVVRGIAKDGEVIDQQGG